MTSFATRLLSVTLASTVATAPVRAQSAGEDELTIYQLDDALKNQTAVASRKAKTVRETPGIVTLVTRDEILGMGARNLADVLLSVPGFQIGSDGSNSTGIAFRGIYGSEGKVLVLVDGVPFNDTLYGEFNVDGYPIEHAETVEIIRGPGSAKYGGYAELAVINIKTRSAKDLSGAEVAASYGQMRGAVGTASLSLGYGWVGENDASVSVLGYAGAGSRSDGTYTDRFGASFNMAGNSTHEPLALNAAAAVGGLQVRFLYHYLPDRTRDLYGDVTPDRYQMSFGRLAADAQYQIRLGDSATLTPRFTYTRSTPWHNPDPSMQYLFYDKTGDRYAGKLTFSWDVASGVGFLAGGEYDWDHGQLNQPGVEWNVPFPGGKPSVDYQNVAGFAELTYDNPIANLLVGARWEHQSQFGSSFVPRAALTKLVDPFHFKLLYAQAFRAPSIENLTSNTGLQPERTQTFEAEVGCQLSRSTFLSVNAFDTKIDNAIVYTSNIEAGPDGVIQYQNAGTTGSRGLEADLRVQARWATMAFSYAFYTPQGINNVAEYAVPGHDGVLLGLAAHKVTARARVPLTPKLSLNPGVVFLSDRYAYTAVDDAGNPVLSRIGPQVYLDLGLGWHDAFTRGLDFGVTLHNLLDSRNDIIAPFRSATGLAAPTPGPSRELMVRLAYHM